MKRIYLLFVAFLLIVNPLRAQDFGADAIEVEVGTIIMSGLETDVTLTWADASDPALQEPVSLTINGVKTMLTVKDGKAILPWTFDREQPSLVVEFGSFRSETITNPIPLWLSILPPLLAIVMALVFREVISALFIGIFSGAAMIGWFSEGFSGIFSGLFSVIDTYIINSLTDWGHLAVIIFSMVIGGIVSVISRNGGMLGVVDRIAVYAKDARSGQLATWILGVAIFFDDYANTLVVGNTMRPVTDKLRISREKLSYLVDSTAAPVAAIAFVTTWIGAELGYIQDGVDTINAGGEQITTGVYGIFINSLPYSYYPILTLCFMVMLILMNRDFGPMFKAEMRARTTGQVSRDGATKSTSSDELDELQPAEGAKHRPLNAILPIAVVILGTIVGLFYTGTISLHGQMVESGLSLNTGFFSVWANMSEFTHEPMGLMRKMGLLIGASDSYSALLWSSICGLLVAILLTVSQRIMSLSATVESAIGGFKTMLPAIMILILAWSLAAVTENMHTADFLTGILKDAVTPWLVPAITFLLAALVAFSTGSSWSTMAILYPIMLGASWNVCMAAGYPPEQAMPIFYNTVACVLAGSVLGDHCSPISDTTILSSLASSCNHIDHVRTQLPYALTVGVVAVVAGTIPSAMGLPPYIGYAIGLAALYAVLKFVGKPVAA